MKWISIVIIGLGVAALPGCSQSDESDLTVLSAELTPFESEAQPSGFTLEESGEYPIAYNYGGPLKPGRLDLEMDLVIGQDNGPDEYIIEYPYQLVVDLGGRIRIVDSRQGKVLVYDRNGKFITKIGRKGAGPGEFPMTPSIFVHGFGTMDAVSDAGRYSRWRSDYSLEFDKGCLRLSQIRGGTTLLTSLDESRLFLLVNPWYGAQSDTATGWWLTQYDTSNDRIESSRRFPRGRPQYINEHYKGNNVGTKMPFVAGLMVSRTIDGEFVIAEGDSSVFWVLDEALQIKQTVRWEATSNPVSRNEFRDALLHSFPWAKAAEINPGSVATITKWLETVVVDRTRPVVASLIVGLDSRVWVECWGEAGWNGTFAEGEPDGQYDYWVFTQTGELEFQTSIPFRIRAADSTHIYELIRDGENTPQVRRWRWNPPN